MTDAKTKRWLDLAIDGDMSQRAAAREVGLPCGVPSRKARELLDAAQRLREMPEAVEWLPGRLEKKERELEKLESEVKDLRRLVEAMEVVIC